MNRKKINHAIILLFCALIGTAQSAQAQRAKEWVEKKENDYYLEGLIAKPVSHTLEFISFYSYLESYEKNKDQDLLVEFYAPEEDSFFLKAEEKRIICHYRMESKPNKLKKGLNQFNPWKVDGFLTSIHCGVPPANLGVLLRVKSDKSQHFLPVAVYHSAPSDSIAEYKAIFRLGKSISRGGFTVHKGEYEGIPDDSNMVQEGIFGRNSMGKPLQINIKRDALKGYVGWVTVNLTLFIKNIRRPASEKFYFYHNDNAK